VSRPVIEPAETCGIVHDRYASKSSATGGCDDNKAYLPRVYPVALTKQSTNADARAFLNYLRSARRPFERQGFTVPVQGQQS
jgi:ABC-type molybdate transport system substrate-binding protein